MEPRSDVCHKCDNYRKLIMDSVTEEDKLAHTEAYNSHVRKARLEQEFYNACIKSSADELASLPETPSGPQQPCSHNLEHTHYNFDFAMSFCLPHQCLQVGPLYFLATLKVHCFGICCEAAKKQVNLLFHEGDSIGTDGKKSHGPNNVISMLHHYLCNFSLGEKKAVFHADNCGGQNKNKTAVHYFIWWVGKGLHQEINYHFMEPGHTKCICDGCFGKIRQLFRRSDVDTPSQLSSLGPEVNRVDFWHDFLLLPENVINNREDSGAILVTALKSMDESQHFSIIIGILSHCYTYMSRDATLSERVTLTFTKFSWQELHCPVHYYEH